MVSTTRQSICQWQTVMQKACKFDNIKLPKLRISHWQSICSWFKMHIIKQTLNTNLWPLVLKMAEPSASFALATEKLKGVELYTNSYSAG